MFYRLVEIMRLAVRCLAANLLRSLLTLLGIVIGVASVIFMMSVTAGARSEILKEMEQLGLRNIIINSVEPVGDDGGRGGQSLDYIKQYGVLHKDITQIRSTCEGVEFVTVAHEVRDEAWLGGKKVNARILGVEPEYFDMLGLRHSTGRLISGLDSTQQRTVCNVGTQLLDDHRIVGDRLAVRFNIGDMFFDVIGVLEEPQYSSRNRKALTSSQRLRNIYIPSLTARRQFGDTSIFRREGARGGVSVEVDQAIVRVESENLVLPVANSIRQILETNHRRRDYDMVVPLELLQQREKAQRVFGITMILIAGISLVVGGIGIINIMLATVTERTREIGIRRACGAKRSHVAYQFLVETTTLSFIGGIIGALVGIGGVHIVAPRIQWTAIVTPDSIVLALGISCIVGILFGTYPAIKASRMDPIEALRFE